MQTYETILARRSVRRFTKRPIGDEIINRLLSCAMAGPSACNYRPWAFYVVKNAEKREALRHVSRFSNLDSTLNIVVAGDLSRSITRADNDFWIQDCAAATENILLAATDAGLGACWCGLYPMAAAVTKVRAALDLPETIVPMALIHLGYPAEAPEPRTQYDAERVYIIE